jgi:ABC-type polysaccharide/polyol phosphate transport system ATPase subunit
MKVESHNAVVADRSLRQKPAKVLLDAVSIDFPIFTASSRGLLNSILRRPAAEEAKLNSIAAFTTEVAALKAVSLELHDGDRLGIVGRNGAGKTTLLRALSGAYEPNRGSVEIDGTVSALTDLSLGMDLEASGRANIRMRASYLGLNRDEGRVFERDVIEFTELGAHIDLPVRVYSSGMMLRLAFAISTTIDPDILIMDEMIGAGDAVFMAKARHRIESIMRKVGILVLASHSDSIITEFCNRCICMSKGSVIFDGSVTDCLAYYKQECEKENGPV